MIRKQGSPALHFLDRYVGIPAAVILGRARRKRDLPAEIRTLGLLRTAAIGDTVLLSGPIADLRAAFPEAFMVLFAGPGNVEMARLVDGIDCVVEVPNANPAAALRRVRSTPVDILLDFGQWPRFDALLARLSGGSFTAGFQTPGQHRHYGYDVAVEHSTEVHEIENFRRLVGALGVPTGHPPRLTAPSPGASPSQLRGVSSLGGRTQEASEAVARRALARAD